MNPLFSVLIANYNNSNYITECILSIQLQTYQNFEIIIVDDCSTDNSIEILNEIIKKDTRIKLFKNEINYGCGYTKAKCAEYAQGEICGYVDPDDKIVPTAIEKMVKKHISNPNISLIGSRRIFCDSNMNIIDIAKPITPRLRDFKNQLDTPFFITHFATFKKSCYLKTSGLDPYMKRGVDQDLYLKLEETGIVDFIDEPLYFYRNNNNSISLNKNYYKATSWHIYCVIEACKRRKLDFDNYCYLTKIKKNKQEKIINFLIYPITFFKRKFIQYLNIKKYYKEIHF